LLNTDSMTWQQRLKECIAAGGLLASSGCSSNHIPCGNVNSDPCICGRPDGNPPLEAECASRDACEANGGQWSDWDCVLASNPTDAGAECFAPEAGVDARAAK